METQNKMEIGDRRINEEDVHTFYPLIPQNKCSFLF